MDKDHIILRRIVEDDLQAVMALENACFAVPWSEQSFKSVFRDCDHDFYGLWEGERLIGYYVLFTLYETGDLMNLCVSPDDRRRGFGRELLADATSRASARGAEVLLLEVRQSNAPARALYESDGFLSYGVRRNYYRLPTENAILMAKKLPGTLPDK